jgi:hypothetical protein
VRQPSQISFSEFSSLDGVSLKAQHSAEMGDKARWNSSPCKKAETASPMSPPESPSIGQWYALRVVAGDSHGKYRVLRNKSHIVTPAGNAGVQATWMYKPYHPWFLDSGNLCRNDEQSDIHFVTIGMSQRPESYDVARDYVSQTASC